MTAGPNKNVGSDDKEREQSTHSGVSKLLEEAFYDAQAAQQSN
jgi:hypothetical protein